jgi:hypothetical protein
MYQHDMEGTLSYPSRSRIRIGKAFHDMLWSVKEVARKFVASTNPDQIQTEIRE